MYNVTFGALKKEEGRNYTMKHHIHTVTMELANYYPDMGSYLILWLKLLHVFGWST